MEKLLKLNHRIPALTERRWMRYLIFSFLYLAQGAPQGMIFLGIPAWMAVNGKTPGQIGNFMAFIIIPWTFKIIFAPLIDRFTYIPMGKKRPWILFGQLGLVASFIALAYVPDPVNHIDRLMWVAFIVSCFGCFQDIATDGLAVDILPEDEQARINGLMWGSKIIGTSVSLALGTWLLNTYGFTTSFLSLALLIGIIFFIPLLVRERPQDKLFPWQSKKLVPFAESTFRQGTGTMIRTLFVAFLGKRSILFALFAFVYCVADGFLEGLLPIFTVQALGWKNDTFAQFYSSANLIGGIVGMIIGGILVDRFGKVKMLKIYMLSMLLVIVAYVTMHNNWSNNAFTSAFFIIYRLYFVFSTIAICAIAMECCVKVVSASQFTLYMMISNMGSVVGAKMIGPVKDHFTWEYTLLVFAVLTVITFISFILYSQSRQSEVVSEFTLTNNFSPANIELRNNK